jgi:solute carrier family 20 (sodium-dependent phosphate transporter)
LLWLPGANDVANSWATSVGSRSLTYLQAMVGASIMEFSGALGVGARVAETIRTKVVKTDSFKAKPALLMLGMLCAVFASSVYLTLATKLGFPVSTTHSIMGGVIGMGIGALGANGIVWTTPGKGTAIISGGVVQVFLAWIIAPVLAGCFGAIIFTTTKYVVLIRKNPVVRGLFLVPVYFALTGALIVMLLLWKGGKYEINLTDAQLPGVIVGVGVGWGLLMGIFLCPWLYRVVVKEDWQLRWWHIPMGPLLLRRGDPPPAPESWAGPVQNYYAGHYTKEELAARRTNVDDVEAKGAEAKNGALADSNSSDRGVEVLPEKRKSLVGPKPDGPMYSPAVIFWFVKWLVFRGVDKDVVNMQGKSSFLGGSAEKVEDMHSQAAHYDNRAEYLYSFLQVMTAATASFTHGANDVSNAIGPYATIFQIWHEGGLPTAGGKTGNSDVPLWILAFGGGAIVIGLWTYGYNIMMNLGNRITLHSPSRGFSMELGSVIAVVMATRLKLPISTTQCITGATVGVGLCNGTWRAINWRLVAWIYLSWFITLPVTGLISGCLMSMIIHSPRW